MIDGPLPSDSPAVARVSTIRIGLFQMVDR